MWPPLGFSNSAVVSNVRSRLNKLLIYQRLELRITELWSKFSAVITNHHGPAVSPFSNYLREVRKRYRMRQEELAQRLGYRQSYLSALEVGTKGPPNEEFLARFVTSLDLSGSDQGALERAVQNSQRKYVIPNTAPMELFLMMRELWEALETLPPAHIQVIRGVIALGEGRRPPGATGADLAHREVAQM